MIDTNRPRASSTSVEECLAVFLGPDQSLIYSKDDLTVSNNGLSGWLEFRGLGSVTGTTPTFKSPSTTRVMELTYYGDLIARRIGDEVDVTMDPMSWEGGIIQSLVNAELGGHWDSRYPGVRRMDPGTRWELEDHDKRRESTGHWSAVEASLLPGFDAQMRNVDEARKDRFTGRKGGRR